MINLNLNKTITIIILCIEYILSILKKTSIYNGFIFLLLIVIGYHIIIFFIRDRKYINAFNEYRDPEFVSINDLEEIPLINFIIPAWKEEKTLKECLSSILNLKYPKVRVILNAGGKKETIQIANSFSKYENFKILEQKLGGKLKAINECFPYVSEGCIYLIDADVVISDEILLRMLLPITNYKEFVVVGHSRPLKSQLKSDLVKYLFITQNLFFRMKFSRYGFNMVSGPNTLLKYEVIKAIDRFSVDSIYSVEISQGRDIISKGFKIYSLTECRGKIFIHLPNKIKIWIKQKIRWTENSIVFQYKHNKIKLLNFIILFLLSLYLIIFPILFYFHIGFLLIAILIFFSLYLKKIRRIMYYRFTTKKENLLKLNVGFFFKIAFYIYIEVLINVYVFFEMMLFGSKGLKKRKNLIKLNAN